jgi:hypothetical protein
LYDLGALRGFKLKREDLFVILSHHIEKGKKIESRDEPRSAKIDMIDVDFEIPFPPALPPL